MYHGARGVLARLARAHHSGDRVSVPRHRSGTPEAAAAQPPPSNPLPVAGQRLAGARRDDAVVQLHTPRLSQDTWACIVAAMGLG